MTQLTKTFTAIAAAAALSAAVLVTPTQPAQARGGAVAAGLLRSPLLVAPRAVLGWLGLARAPRPRLRLIAPNTRRL